MFAGSQGLTCSICLKRLRCCRLGKPAPCEHVFCFTCIFEWAKNVNTCPVDRISFNIIEVFNYVGGECVEQVYVPDQVVDDEPPDFTHCEVCRDHHREHELLLCDGCDKGYHLGCLTPALSEVPEGDWYCPTCQPIVDAQYFDSLESSSSETETRMEWDFSSGSDSDVQRRRGVTRVVISDSEGSESESDSDVDELRTRRTIQNVCAIGEPRVLVSESSSEEDVELVNIREGTPRKQGPVTNLPSPQHGAVESPYDSLASGFCSDEIEHSEAINSSTHTLSSSPVIRSPVKGESYVEFMRKLSQSSKTSGKPKFSTPSASRMSRGDSPTPIKKEADSPSARQQPKLFQPSTSDGKFKAFFQPISVLVTPMALRRTRPSIAGPPACASSPARNGSQTKPSASSNNKRRRSRNRKRKRRRKRKKIVLGTRKRPRYKKNEKRYKPTWYTDYPYKPSISVTQAKDTIRTHSKARTVASYTPQLLTFRQAVRESYKHSDTCTGLENARRIILESGVDPTSFRHGPLTHNHPFNMRSPQSGYCSDRSRYKGELTQTPQGMADEIARRTVPMGSKRLSVAFSNAPRLIEPLSHTKTTSESTGSGLVDEIFQSLDDLNNSSNIIQRDGTILPLRCDPFEPVSPPQTSLSAKIKFEPISPPQRSPYTNTFEPVTPPLSTKTKYTPCTSSFCLTPENTSRLAFDSRCSILTLSAGVVPVSSDYDSSEPELVIDEQGVDSEASQDNCRQTQPLPEVMHTQKIFPQNVTHHRSIHTTNKPAWSTSPHNHIPHPVNNPSEEPSSSTDGLKNLIDTKSLSAIRSFIKTELDKHRIAGAISSHQYRRILERATNKVKAGKTTTLERVRKLVSDFVDLYKLSSS